MVNFTPACLLPYSHKYEIWEILRSGNMSNAPYKYTQDYLLLSHHFHNFNDDVEFLINSSIILIKI